MRVQPCQMFNNNNIYFKNQPPKKKIQPKTVALAAAGIAGSLAVGALIYTVSRGRKSSALTDAVSEIPAYLKTFEKEIEMFPQDINYRKALLKGLGIAPENYAKLRPLAGPQEYKTIVQTFSYDGKFYTPGESLINKTQDGYVNLSGKHNGTYRANMHMHTQHSDGKLTVQELLDKSAKYADEVAQKFENTTGVEAKHAPFTIAITDHDTLEGCKEAVDIIYKNPEKYKNLRVVLGCEMTVENMTIPQELKSPIPNHLLLHGINPFDTNLNEFLNIRKNARYDLVNDILNKASEKLRDKYPKTAQILSYDDATVLYPTFKHRILHVDYSTKDYLQFRTIYSECFENNQEIQNLIQGKNVGNYSTPKEKYFGEIKENFGDTYWKKYLIALQKYTAELLGISEKEAAEKVKVTPELEKTLEELVQLSNEASPKLNLTSAFANIEDVITLIKLQEHGYMSIAHPGLTGIGDCLVNPNESMQGMLDLFRYFKIKGENRAISAEVHYPYFGQVGESTEWLNNISSYIKNSNLYNGGGLDTHGTSIFYSCKAEP